MLGRISDKWFTIGIQLGIPYHVLKQFRKEEDPLSAAIDYWLTGNVADSGAPILWDSIIEALKAGSIKETALAEELAKKYCQWEEERDDTKGVLITK